MLHKMLFLMPRVKRRKKETSVFTKRMPCRESPWDLFGLQIFTGSDRESQGNTSFCKTAKIQ